MAKRGSKKLGRCAKKCKGRTLKAFRRCMTTCACPGGSKRVRRTKRRAKR